MEFSLHLEYWQESSLKQEPRGITTVSKPFRYWNVARVAWRLINVTRLRPDRSQHESASSVIINLTVRRAKSPFLLAHISDSIAMIAKYHQ